VWYTGRANVGYCFLCASPTCKNERLHKYTGTTISSFGQSKINILWQVWLAKCVDSTPLVVGYSLGETNGTEEESQKVMCYVGSHKGIVVAVEGTVALFLYFFFDFYLLFFTL
jgi:hypothetical protein